MRPACNNASLGQRSADPGHQRRNSSSLAGHKGEAHDIGRSLSHSLLKAVEGAPPAHHDERDLVSVRLHPRRERCDGGAERNPRKGSMDEEQVHGIEIEGVRV